MHPFLWWRQLPAARRFLSDACDDRLASGHLLELFGVAGARHDDFRGGEELTPAKS
jgi:hypothetical protein